MLQHIQDYWWACWGMGFGVVWMVLQYHRTDAEQPRDRRLRSLIRGYDEHEGGIPPRVLLLAGIALLILAINALVEVIR